MWHQVKGVLRAKWGDLTDDEIEEIDGSREKMVGKIQETFGVAKEEAEKQVDEWTRSHKWPLPATGESAAAL